MDHPDTVIEREVLAELDSNHGIHATNLVVKASAGIVTLSGTVQSPRQRAAAALAAFGVRGVIEVDNTLVVKPSYPEQNDMRIAHDVRHALVWNPLVPDDAIRSNVIHGAVRLDGIVSDPVERDEAERSIRGLPGVRQVYNLIAVRPRRAEGPGLGRSSSHAPSR